MTFTECQIKVILKEGKKMKRSLAMMLVLIMVCALPGIASAKGNGSIESAGITHEGGYLKDAVFIELQDITFEKSVKVELFSGDTLLTTATLNEGKLYANTPYQFVTCCIPTKGADEAWSLTPWIPRDKIVPNKAVLFVDDNKMDTMEFTLDAAEYGHYGIHSGCCRVESPARHCVPRQHRARRYYA